MTASSTLTTDQDASHSKQLDLTQLRINPTAGFASPSPESPRSDETPSADQQPIANVILLRAISNLDQDGNPAKTFLYASAESVWIGTFQGSEDEFGMISTCDEIKPRFVISQHWKLSDFSKIRTWSGTGLGTLQAKSGDIWVNLLRFTNSLADTFHHVSQGLNRIKNDELTEQSEIPIETIRRCPKCQLRLTKHADECPRCLHRSRIVTRIWELVRPQLNGTILLCLLTIFGVVAELVPPMLQRYMVDGILVKHSETAEKAPFFTALMVVVLALATSRVLLSIVAWFKGRLATKIGAGLTYTLRGKMVERLQQLAIAYYDRHQVGSLMSRVAYDSEVLQGLLHQLTGGFLLQIVQLVGVGGCLLWINPKLTFYTLIPVPLVILGTMFFWRYVYPRYYRLWDSSSKQNAALNDMLSGIRVVKAFAQEKKTYSRFDESSQYMRDSRLWVDHATSAYSATMGVVFSLGGFIVWYVGGIDVIRESMSLGELIAFIAYLAMFYAPLAMLSNFTTWLTSFLTGSKRVLELLDSPITIKEPSVTKQPESILGEIRFENVTFGYEPHQPVIHDVSFTVAAGEMVGIVGRSGSGKTTMINLLGRFYEAQEGRILIDGIDIRDLSQELLRQNIGVVLQESFLFRGTIWENLTFGKSDATFEKGLESAKAAGAHDFICRSPLAYETHLGERGAGLSGGEKQRLSIARTLLYDPKILVLDEATSNIDAEAEKAIQNALQSLIKGRTTIAIAHRLSTLRNADRIIVFDRGRLMEQGSHTELLDADGIYARLVRLQTQISKNPAVDKLLHHETELTLESKDSQVPDPDATDLTPENSIKWLSPEVCEFMADIDGAIGLRWREGDQLRICNLFAVACFPASQPNRFLSIRGWNEHEDEVEIGVILDPSDWPEDQRSLIAKALNSRYYLPRIEAIHSIEAEGGYLDFDVETENGRVQFTVRWSHSQAVEFGERGKLLIDTDDNRYVVPDVESLPKADRAAFKQYIYW